MYRVIFFPFSFFLILFLFSCTPERLFVHTEYRTIERLASVHVGTPDPRIASPMVGQLLIIDWNLDEDFCTYSEVKLKVIVRFGNHEEDSLEVLVTRSKGGYTYYLLNQDYFCKKGIETYKVDLFADGELLEERLHPLWVNLINFGED